MLRELPTTHCAAAVAGFPTVAPYRAMANEARRPDQDVGEAEARVSSAEGPGDRGPPRLRHGVPEDCTGLRRKNSGAPRQRLRRPCRSRSPDTRGHLSLIHISEPTRRTPIS